MTVPPRPTATKPKPRRRNGFISYAHADYRMFEAFCVHLGAIEQAYGIHFWSDKRTKAGYHWEPEILTHIEAADVIVALASAAFIASNYIKDKEIPAIIARQSLPDPCLVLPVILKPCAWGQMMARRQAVPTQNGAVRPIALWRPVSYGHDRARQQISEAIQGFHGWEPEAMEI